MLRFIAGAVSFAVLIPHSWCVYEVTRHYITVLPPMRALECTTVAVAARTLLPMTAIWNRYRDDTERDRAEIVGTVYSVATCLFSVALWAWIT